MIRRARGTLTIVRAIAADRGAAYLPPDRLRERRDRRVRETVRYAAEHVPFYRDYFRREAADPRELRTAAHLSSLPLLDKTAVHGELERFNSTAHDARDTVPLRTSGRSGAWLQVRHDRESLLAGIAYAERERAVEGHFAGRRYRYSMVEIRSEDSSVGHTQDAYRRTSFRPLRPRTHLISIETTTDRVIAELNRLQPDVLRTYGSYAEVLFRYVAAADVAVARPRVVMYGGDAMSAAGRAFIEERFGVPVISRYGAVETPRIGFMCEARSGFHLNEDLCHLRLVDADGSDVADGEVGEVVVSNLVNRGTVLLNYRLGDYARFADGPCPCGRTLRRLQGLEGRVAEVLQLGSGFVHQYAIWHALTVIDDLVNFQLVQRAPERFELRLQPAAREAFEPVATAAGERVRSLLPGSVVEPVYVERLDLERRGGKLRRIVPFEEPGG